MKPLSVPAWSWMILASHIFPCFSSKTRFHKWSCNFVYLLAPQLSNFAAWIHSYCGIYNTPCKVGIDPWTNPSHVNFMPWHPGIALSLKSNPFRFFSETSSEESAYVVAMTKTLSGANKPTQTVSTEVERWRLSLKSYSHWCFLTDKKEPPLEWGELVLHANEIFTTSREGILF